MQSRTQPCARDAKPACTHEAGKHAFRRTAPCPPSCAPCTSCKSGMRPVHTQIIHGCHSHCIGDLYCSCSFVPLQSAGTGGDLMSAMMARCWKVQWMIPGPMQTFERAPSSPTTTSQLAMVGTHATPLSRKIALTASPWRLWLPMRWGVHT